MNTSVPNHFRPGALPRVTDFGKLKGVEPFAERLDVIPRGDWLDIIRSENSPDLYTDVWNVYDQNGYGSCASEGSSKGIETLREASNKPRVLLNPLFVYHTVSGGRDGGSSLDDNVAFLKKYGCAPDSVWSRSNGFRKKPTDEAYGAAEGFRLDEVYDINNTNYNTFVDEFGTGLLKRHPVYFGYPGHAILAIRLVENDPSKPYIKASADSMDEYLVRRGLLTQSEKVGDFTENLYIEYLNSWNVAWGNKGRGYLRFSRVQRNYGAFLFWTTNEN